MQYAAAAVVACLPCSGTSGTFLVVRPAGCCMWLHGCMSALQWCCVVAAAAVFHVPFVVLVASVTPAVSSCWVPKAFTQARSACLCHRVSSWLVGHLQARMTHNLSKRRRAITAHQTRRCTHTVCMQACCQRLTWPPSTARSQGYTGGIVANAVLHVHALASASASDAGKAGASKPIHTLLPALQPRPPHLHRVPYRSLVLLSAHLSCQQLCGVCSGHGASAHRPCCSWQAHPCSACYWSVCAALSLSKVSERLHAHMVCRLTAGTHSSSDCSSTPTGV